MARQITATLVVAAYGAFLSTLVFGWNLLRDLSDRGRLRVSATIRDLIQFGVGVIQENQIAYAITNTGRRTVWVHGLGGLFSRGGFIVGVTLNQLPHRLEPGQVLTELVPPGQHDPLRMWRYCAWDSLGKYYWVPRKQQRELQRELLKFEKRPERLGFRAFVRPFLPRWTRI